MGSWPSSRIAIVFLYKVILWVSGSNTGCTQIQTSLCCRPLLGPSFWFERLVEGACRDEGGDFAMGHRCKYKYSRGADGCCHVRENSAGLHKRLLLITSNFHGLHFFDIFRSSPIGAVLKLTHTHTHSFQSPCGQTQLRTKESKHSHSLEHTHRHAHASFSTAPKLLRGFSNCLSCHSHPHSY